MGFGVSASYAIVVLALLISLGAMYGTVSNTGERTADAIADQQRQFDEMLRTNVTITSADYRGNTLTLDVENTGQTQLSVSDTDLLVDGEYIVEANRSSTVSGDGSTDVWSQGETLELSVDLPTPDRVKIVTEYGVAVTTTVEVFSLTANVAFTNSSSFLRSYGSDNQFTNYTGTATAVGPPITNFVSENTKEIPSINSSGDVVVATARGDRTILASGAKTSSSRLSAGRWQGSEPSVFFPKSSSKNITRVTRDGTTTEIDANLDIDAQGIAGIGDIDGDGADELIYGSNDGPIEGASNSIAYVDDDGTLAGTQVGYGTNNNVGLGEPADFDGDGTVRVPIVDGGNDILLVDDAGGTQKVLSSGTAAKAPMATGNFDGDDHLEIYFLDGSSPNTLKLLDNVTVDNTVRTVTDDQGDTISGDIGVGVA